MTSLAGEGLPNGLRFDMEPHFQVNWCERMAEGPGLYWRFESFVTFTSGAYPAHPHIYVTQYHAVRETPKGVWVVGEYGENKKFVLHAARKKWAYPTKQEAWDTFLIRLHWRRSHHDTEGQRLHALEHLAAQERERLTTTQGGDA